MGLTIVMVCLVTLGTSTVVVVLLLCCSTKVKLSRFYGVVILVKLCIKPSLCSLLSPSQIGVDQGSLAIYSVLLVFQFKKQGTRLKYTKREQREMLPFY